MTRASRAAALIAEKKHAWLTKVDEVAMAMEAKWGVGRLPRLVEPDLAARFQCQLEMWNEVICSDDCMVSEVRETAEATIRGWQVLDEAASAAGQSAIDPSIWEIPLKDGTVAALVRSDEEAYKVASTLSGRYVSVWTTEEVAKIVSHHPEIIQVKQVFPGAKVIRIRSRNARDEAGLNDPIPF